MPFLRVLEVKATNLPSVDGKKGKSDPYASLECQGTPNVFLCRKSNL